METGSSRFLQPAVQSGRNGSTYSGDRINTGDYNVTAHYAGDANHTASDGAAVPITINSSGLLDLNNFSDTIGTITFSGGHLSTGTGIATLTGNTTANANTNNMARMDGIVSMSNTRTYNVAQGIWSPDLQVNATVIGAGGITKTGAGEMRLSSSNSYSGLTTVGTGLLVIEDSFGLGATNTGTVVSNSASLAVNFGSHVGLETLTLNGPGDLGFGALGGYFGSNSWAGAITLGSDSTVSVYATNDFLNLSGPISGTGNFTKIWPGTLILSGSVANTYSGSTFMNEGTMLLGKSGGSDSTIPHDLTVGDGTGTDVVRHLAVNQISNTSHVTVNVGGLLDLNNFLDGIADLELTGGAVNSGTSFLLLVSGGVTANASSTTATIDGTLTLNNAVRTFDIASGAASPELRISAVINTGGIIKTGSGNLQLLGTNTYTGLTTISNGFIEVNNAAGLGATNAGTVLAGTGTCHLLINGVSVVGEGLTNNSSTSDFRSSGPSGWSGNIVLNAQLDILPFGTTFDLSGVISGSGAVTKSQTGTLIYSGGSANTYTNTTTVISGKLQLSKTSVNGTILGDLTIGDGVGGAGADIVQLTADNQIGNTSLIHLTGSGLFDLNSNFENTGAIDGSGGQINFGAGGTLQAGSGNGSTTYGGTIIGTGTLFKFGTGTWTLAGNNTYTGTTTVSAGTLAVNGSQPQSPVTVNGTATLGGSGTVGNIFVFGNLAPGNSPGTLTCSNVAFNSSAADYYVDLTGPTAGTDYDQLNVRGTNALASAVLHVTAAFTNPVAIGQKFTILNNDLADAITGTFNGLAEGAAISSSGYNFTISYVGGTGNDVVLTLTNVPGAVVSAAVSSGNGNHAIDPNECNTVSLVISNKSGALMSGINAVLSTTNPSVIISQPYSAYVNLAASGKGTNTTPFQISTLSSFACGTDINLLLSVDSSAGSFITSFVLHTGEQPALYSQYDNSTVTAIPDIGSIDSTNVVAGFVGPLTKVDVLLYLTHTLDADLTNISLIAPDGTTVLLSAANGGSGQNYGTNCSPDTGRTTFDDLSGTSITSGTAPFVGIAYRPQSPLSVLNYNATLNGNWKLHIADGFGGSLGTLRCWSLQLFGTTCASGGGACDYCLTSITGSITNTDLLLTNRLLRNNIEAGCGAPKAFPGLQAGTFHYDLYTFTNTSVNDACVTVLLTSTGDVQAGVYLNAFDPSNLATNYAADSGNSTVTGIGGFIGTPGPQSCSATIPTGAKFFVEVNEPILGVGSTNYTLQLSGLPCPPPVLNIQTVQTNKARLSWPSWAGGYLLEATPSLLLTNYVSITNEPIVTSLKYNVTNSSSSPTNRFYRLHKP